MSHPILMYHQVDTSPPRGTPWRSLIVTPSAFARQMATLRLLGYRGVSLRDLEPWLTGEHSDRVVTARQDKLVGISFDDGYRNNLEYALPVLRANGFTATCYAISDALGASNEWDADKGVQSKPLMTADELRQWIASGMDVGAHTRHHVDLKAQDSDVARDEIFGAKRELEAALGTEVRHFCYPYGSFDASHRAMVEAAGYVSATTVQRGRANSADDRYALPRIPIVHSTTLPVFVAKIATRYEDRHR